MLRVTMATDRGSSGQPNEDFVGATANAVVLLDGAGSDDLENGCVHGVAWFTRQLGGQLLERMWDLDLPLRIVLTQSIEAVAGFHADTCDLLHSGTPSATVVMMRRSPPEMEHLVLGNSVLLLALPDGGIESISDNRRNRGGRFFVAAADPRVAVQAFVGRTSVEVIREAVLLSNGASRLLDQFDLETWPQLVAFVGGSGPESLIGTVRDAERSEPPGATPEDTTSDSLTIALCEFAIGSSFAVDVRESPH